MFIFAHFKHGCNVSPFLFTGDFAWLPWMLKYDGERLGNFIIKFSQNSGMHWSPWTCIYSYSSAVLLLDLLPQMFSNWTFSCDGSTFLPQFLPWGSGTWDRNLEKTDSVSMSFLFKYFNIGSSDILGVLEHGIWSPAFCPEGYEVLISPVSHLPSLYRFLSYPEVS